MRDCILTPQRSELAGSEDIRYENLLLMHEDLEGLLAGVEG